MIVRLNEKQLLSSIATSKHKELCDDISAFINDVQKVEGLTKQIRSRYHTDKLTSTKDVFKFRLSNGYRCLFKYHSDNRIFPLESEIVLLKVVEHDIQGEEGRRLGGIDINEDDYQVATLDLSQFDEESPEAYDKYYRFIPVHSSINTETLMQKMSEADNRFLYPLQGIQDEVLDAPGPILLMGSAGSGKTLVEISKALKNAYDPYKQLYITFTSMLKDSGEALYDRYKAIPGLEGQTDFHVMKQFLLQAANLNDAQYFSFERFLEWLRDNAYLNKYDYLRDIDPIDLWTEIRGIIKGYAGNYFRSLEIKDPYRFVKKPVIKEWIAEGYIKKQKDSNTVFQILDIEKLYPILKENVPRLFDELKQQDLDKSMIDKHTYLHGMSDKYSIFDETIKEQLYTFVETIYQPYLEEKNLYDDNDLARLLRNKIYQKAVSAYDYVFIDEVQDLSELQILAFLELTDHPKNVYMTGDVSQIINPTLFVKGRVGAIYKQRFAPVELNTKFILNQNFRNTQRILDIVLKLLDIRQDRLGIYSDDIREVSRAEEDNAGTPFMIKIEEEELLSTMKTWLAVPNVAIIVSTERSKKRLKSELGIPIKDETNIFTVQEVKGREFKKTILYNIVSDFKDMWSQIIQGPKTRDKSIVTKYMYYFNLLYVAMTRAKYNVFVYEKDTPDIIKTIEPLFEILEQNINTIMNISDYDTLEKRHQQAQQYFEAGDYERAKTYYWQLDDTKMADVSKAYAYIQKGQYERGVLMLYPFNEHHQYALNYTEDLPLLNRLLVYKIHEEATKDQVKNIKEENIIDRLKTYEDYDIYPLLLNDTLKFISNLRSQQINQHLKNLGKEG